MKTGTFITFEGGEGTGKSTQIQLLQKVLLANGHSVFCTREPGGVPIAEAVRSILLSATDAPLIRTELLLFMSARSEVVAKVIRPHLEAGDVVICDRHIDSSVAYQGHARGLGRDIVVLLNEFATNHLYPDLTILLDLDPTIGLSRQPDRNRMEEAGLLFHKKVRRGYLAEAKMSPDRFAVISAEGDVTTVHQQIIAAINNRKLFQKEVALSDIAR